MADHRAEMAEILGDKYELVRLLGEGGMGSVWEARNRITGKRVAVKRMNPALVGNHEAVQRFLREARAATRIEHPNVVEIYDVGVHDGAPFMVMEYLDGEALSALRARLGVIDATALIELMIPVMRALAATHALGIVHRDLKPDNIYLVRRGARLIPKVLDFGISKTLGDTDPRLTSTGAIMGTPYYMAPEQCAGRKDLDHRADIYSLGVILYEALAGRVPFDAETYNALIVAVATSDAPTVGSLRSDVPASVSAVVERAMSRDLDVRYASVTDFGRALEEAIGRPGLWESHPDSAPTPPQSSAFAATMPAGAVSSVRAPAPVAALAARSTLGSAVGELAVVPPPAASRRAWIAGGAVATIALVAAAAFAFAGSDGVPPSSGSPTAPASRSIVTPSATRASSAGDDAGAPASALARLADGQDLPAGEPIAAQAPSKTRDGRRLRSTTAHPAEADREQGTTVDAPPPAPASTAPPAQTTHPTPRGAGRSGSLEVGDF